MCVIPAFDISKDKFYFYIVLCFVQQKECTDVNE